MLSTNAALSFRTAHYNRRSPIPNIFGKRAWTYIIGWVAESDTWSSPTKYIQTLGKPRTLPRHFSDPGDPFGQNVGSRSERALLGFDGPT